MTTDILEYLDCLGQLDLMVKERKGRKAFLVFRVEGAFLDQMDLVDTLVKRGTLALLDLLDLMDSKE